MKYSENDLTKKGKNEMKKNRKMLIWTICVITIVLFAIFGVFKGRHEDDVIRIGILSFLTGNFAEMGVDLVDGAQLAVETLNKSGWMLENKKRAKLIVEDGKVEPKTTVTGFRKMLLSNPLCAIVAGDTPVPAAAPLINAEEVPTIATIVSTVGFLDEKRPWIYRNYVSISSAAKYMCRYARQELDAKGVSIIYMQSEYGVEGAHAFEKEFIGLGGKITGLESYMPDTLDARAVISKSLTQQPQMVYILGYGTGYNTVVNQVRESGFNGRILTDEPISSPGSVSSIRDFSNIFFTSQRTPETTDYVHFAEEYKAKYKKEPSLYATYGYDSVWILAQVITNTPITRMAIRERLLSGRAFSTLRGEIRFEANGDCVLPIVINKMNPDGTYTQVQ